MIRTNKTKKKIVKKINPNIKVKVVKLGKKIIKKKIIKKIKLSKKKLKIIPKKKVLISKKEEESIKLKKLAHNPIIGPSLYSWESKATCRSD